MFKDDFEEIVKRLSPTIRRISHKLNGRFTFFNDDDLCQEALTRLWLLFREGALSDKTDSYILQGCYFHLKNYIRTAVDGVNFTSFENPVDEDGTTLQDILASENDAYFDGLENKTLREAVEQNDLTAREKKVLDLCLEGMTMREIGQKIGISHVAVIKLRKRIREKCRILEKEIKKIER
jgi:RNA polymerase sigma factor (sigma-70 family)